MHNKIKTAIEFLKDGQSFSIGDLRLSMNAPDEIAVTGWSSYTNFQSLTKKNALIELEEIKEVFNDMVGSSDELKIFLAGKKIEFNLDFDDYGKGSIGICSEKEGTLIWKIKS